MQRHWGWVVTVGWAIAGAIAQPVAAQSQLHITLDAPSSSDFRSLMQQAELAAQGLIQQAFAATPTDSYVSVMVLGDYNGQVAPLLMVTVARDQWQQDRSLAEWTRYFRDSAVLLGYVAPTQRSQPVVPSVVPVPLAYSPVPPWLSDIEPNFYQ